MSSGKVGGNLPVMEVFYSIQGEGYHSGRAASFIRLGGCDVGCVWCDVKESWEAGAHPSFTSEELLEKVLANPSRFVVITGGEPLTYDLTELTRLLHQNGFEIAVETSGAYALSGEWDWICVSPKKFKAPLKEVLAMADELKVVVYNSSDFDWAEESAASCKPKAIRYLQPEYSRFDKSAPLIFDYVRSHPAWKLSLQTHKVINVP